MRSTRADLERMDRWTMRVLGYDVTGSAHRWKDRDGCRWHIQFWHPERGFIVSRLGIVSSSAPRGTVEETRCPSCGAVPGEPCRTSSGLSHFRRLVRATRKRRWLA